MTISITRRLEWDYGHRVLGHEGKCKHLHGHRGVAEITVKAETLDSLGRVIDFSVIKKEVGGWIDANWDHSILLNPDDPLYQQCKEMDVWGGKEPFLFEAGLVFKANTNPTAENMATFLLYKSVELLAPYHIQVLHIRVYETPNSWADAFNR